MADTIATTHFKDFCIKFIKIANCKSSAQNYVTSTTTITTILDQDTTQQPFYDDGIDKKVKLIFASLVDTAVEKVTASLIDVNEQVVSKKYLTVGSHYETLLSASSIEIAISNSLEPKSSNSLPHWLDANAISIFNTTDDRSDTNKKKLVDFNKPISADDVVTNKIFSLFKYQNTSNTKDKYVWKNKINMFLLFKPQILLLTFDIFCYNAGKKLFDKQFNTSSETESTITPINVTHLNTLDIKSIRPSFFMLLIYYAGYNFSIDLNSITSKFTKKFKGNSFDIISYIENEKERLYIEKYSTNIDPHKVNLDVETLELFYVGSIDSLWDYVNGKLTILIYNMLRHEDKADHYANLFKKRYASNKLFLLECIKELKQYKQYISNSDITYLLFPVSTLKAIEILLVKLPYILHQIDVNYIPIESVSFDVTINNNTNTYTINSEYETTLDRQSSLNRRGAIGSDDRIIDRIFALWQEELIKVYTELAKYTNISEPGRHVSFADDLQIGRQSGSQSQTIDEINTDSKSGLDTAEMVAEQARHSEEDTHLPGDSTVDSNLNFITDTLELNNGIVADLATNIREQVINVQSNVRTASDSLAKALEKVNNRISEAQTEPEPEPEANSINDNIVRKAGEIENVISEVGGTATEVTNAVKSVLSNNTAALQALDAVNTEGDNINDNIVRNAGEIENVISEVGRATTEVTNAVKSVLSNNTAAIQALNDVSAKVDTKSREARAARNAAMAAVSKAERAARTEARMAARVAAATDARAVARMDARAAARAEMGEDMDDLQSKARDSRAAKAQAAAEAAGAAPAAGGVVDAGGAGGAAANRNSNRVKPPRQMSSKEKRITGTESLKEIQSKLTDLLRAIKLEQATVMGLSFEDNKIYQKLVKDILSFIFNDLLIFTTAIDSFERIIDDRNTFGEPFTVMDTPQQALKKLIDSKDSLYAQLNKIFEKITASKFIDTTIYDKLDKKIQAVRDYLVVINSMIGTLNSSINPTSVGGNIKYNNSTVKLSSRSDNTKTRKK